MRGEIFQRELRCNFLTEHRAYIGLVARGSGEADIITTFKRSLASACIGMVWNDIGQM